VLKACSRLSLNLEQCWLDKETVSLMAVLHQDWQPSAEALQPLSCSSAEPQHTISSNPKEWRLAILHTFCSRQCMSLLPKGLNCLELE
jgi:hypothetical protein